MYWRGTAATRERVEAELVSARAVTVRQRTAAAVDPQAVLAEVRQFVELARAGSYIAGDRRVRPKERTQWRFTFKRLVSQSRDALRAGDGTVGAAALEVLLDLASDLRTYLYFRSEDAVEAAGIVVSDEVAVLWGRLLEREGLAAFCERAMPQFIRWESQYGGTLRGYGKVAEREVPLVTVLERMLPAPDCWTLAADAYLTALDRFVPVKTPRSRRSWDDDRTHRERPGALALWHEMLLDRFVGTDEEDRLDRLTAHPALDGPEIVYLRARLALRRGDTGRATMRWCRNASTPCPDTVTSSTSPPRSVRRYRSGRGGRAVTTGDPSVGAGHQPLRWCSVSVVTLLSVPATDHPRRSAPISHSAAPAPPRSVGGFASRRQPQAALALVHAPAGGRAARHPRHRPGFSCVLR
ncbi:hypothetical protein QEZ54_23235 [Catellatospora sp. KI3]|uniref:hypothetical protein n=1 Tax=Catellatospora sp. KI3 TaxID=3041620 RepID=UPI002482BBF5|nr:hypothetical protein [Catellatospora sp. KI3]MDI1463905.1 hypothetical protein [Catellatospora sp. KI3]